LTKFEHLSVLISIIIGLGITQLLSDIHKLIQARTRVRSYSLTIAWTIILFITMVEWWWASFEFRKEDFNFFFYLFVLLSPITLYLAVAFVLPDVTDEQTPIDMKAYYYKTRGYFFPLVAIGPVFDAIRRFLQGDEMFSVVSNLISAVLVGALAFTDNSAVHIAVTLIVGALFGSFLIVN
jgi:hypothetical protein